REVGRTIEVPGRREHQAVEGGVDVGEGAGDGDRAGAVAADGEAGGAREGQQAVGGGERDLDVGAAGIDIGDGDGVAVGAREGERAVLAHGLSGGYRIHRRIVHGVDGDGDGVDVAERAAGARVAEVAGGDREVGRTVEVPSRLEHQAVEGGVDVGQRAGDGDRAGAVAADGEAGGAGERQHTIRDGQRDLDTARASIDIGDGDGVAVGARERQRAVLIHGLGGRYRVHRRVVDSVDGDRDRIDVG